MLDALREEIWRLHLELPRKDGTGMRQMRFDYRAVPDGKIHPNCRCGFLPIMRGET